MYNKMYCRALLRYMEQSWIEIKMAWSVPLLPSKAVPDLQQDILCSIPQRIVSVQNVIWGVYQDGMLSCMIRPIPRSLAVWKALYLLPCVLSVWPTSSQCILGEVPKGGQCWQIQKSSIYLHWWRSTINNMRANCKIDQKSNLLARMWSQLGGVRAIGSEFRWIGRRFYEGRPHHPAAWHI